MKTPFRIGLWMLALWVTIPCAFAQKSDIEQCIHNLFDGMRAGDSAQVAQTFAPELVLQTTYTDKDGNARLHSEKPIDFLTAVGTPHKEVWDERISNLSIQIDGNIAHAWMNYSFYVDDVFSHCGVNAMTLFFNGEQWRIIHLIDTRRKTSCD